jgi:hypothetical protein
LFPPFILEPIHHVVFGSVINLLQILFFDQYSHVSFRLCYLRFYKLLLDWLFSSLIFEFEVLTHETAFGCIVKERRKVSFSRTKINLYHFLEDVGDSVLEVITLLEKMQEKALPLFFYLEQLILIMVNFLLSLTNLASNILDIFLDSNDFILIIIFNGLLSSSFLSFHQIGYILLRKFFMFDLFKRGVNLTVF